MTKLLEPEPKVMAIEPVARVRSCVPSPRQSDHGDGGLPSGSKSFAEVLLAWSAEIEARPLTFAEFLEERR